MADDERGQRTLFDVFERRLDALLLMRERLASGKRERGIPGCERVEALGRLRTDLLEAAVGPVAGVGLHQARVLFRLEAYALGDRVGGFARAQQRAAPQRAKAVRARVLGELDGLRAPGRIERNRLLTLEATLEVVGGLTVAREVDGACRAPRQGQRASKRSRFMTLSHAAMKSSTNFSFASSAA